MTNDSRLDQAMVFGAWYRPVDTLVIHFLNSLLYASVLFLTGVSYRSVECRIRLRRKDRMVNGAGKSGEEACYRDEGLPDGVGGESKFFQGDGAEEGQAARRSGEKEGDAYLCHRE